MAEMKKTLAAQEFKATKKTVQGDAMEGFKQSVVKTVGGVAKGVGQGYATEKGEQQLGTDETVEEATAYVEEAFSAAQPPAEAGEGGLTADVAEPTEDQAQKMQATFLNQADLSDKKIQAALTQGRISSREANDLRVRNRKQFMSNPLSAMFVAQYDNVVGGGKSGASRAKFFGMTAGEKAQAKLTLDRQVARNERQIAIDKLSADYGLDRDVAASVYADRERMAADRIALENHDAVGKLGGTQKYKLMEYRINDVHNEMEQVAAALAKLGGEEGTKAGDIEDFRIQLKAQRDMLEKEVRNGGMTVGGAALAMKKIKDMSDNMLADAKSGSFTTLQAEIGKENDVAQKMIADNEFMQLLQDNPLARAIFGITGERRGLVDAMKSVAYWQTDAGKLELANLGPYGVRLGEYFSGTEVAKRFAEATGKVLGEDDDPMTEEEQALSSLSLNSPGFADLYMKKFKLNPEGLERRIREMSSIDLKSLSRNKQWTSVVNNKEDPDGAYIMTAVIDHAAHTARNKQRRFDPDGDGYGELPENIKITEPTLKRGANDSLQWTFDFGGVKGSDRYKAEIIGAYRMAKASPHLWRATPDKKGFKTIEDYINSKFANGGSKRFKAGFDAEYVETPEAPVVPRNFMPKSVRTTTDTGPVERKARHNNRGHMKAESGKKAE